MTLKKLLGLEECSLSEEEIYRRIEEGQQRHLHEIEFLSPKGNVKVRLKEINLAGLTKGYWDYYGGAK